MVKDGDEGMADDHQPDPHAQWWTTTDVASYLAVDLRTVSSYRSRGEMPEPDQRFGQSWVWAPQRIVEWDKSRTRSRRARGQNPN